MKAGFVMLNRNIEESPFFSKPNYLAIYIYCLLHANHKANTFLFDNHLITVPEGSFIGSQLEISKHFNLSLGGVNKIIKGLQNAGYLEVKPTTKHTYFTVSNYRQIFQKCENKKTADNIDNKGSEGCGFSERENKVKTKCKQSETNNNIYINNKGKSNKLSQIDIRNIQELKEPIFYKNSYFFIPESYKRELLSIYPGITAGDLLRELDKMEIWIKDKGKHLTNYKNFISNWLQKAKPSPAAESHQMKISELNYV